ncbi:hypothetical protein FQA47_021267 [Oryzias melastigma]|uniref:Uncharacterized protein n=1 Tax=Oryzias melastigma TaxID=30732 RepID=A0A834BPP0_ORYME|nr:hypothetical protein FQA47_021267 [Oryzias melastigma]
MDPYISSAIDLRGRGKCCSKGRRVEEGGREGGRGEEGQRDCSIAGDRRQQPSRAAQVRRERKKIRKEKKEEEQKEEALE